MARLIVGLGNPERKYLFTKHNIGWLALDSLDNRYSLSWRDKFKGSYCSVNDFDEKIFLLKPMTYMNLSGESVAPAAKFFKIEPKDILVIHDELDLPFGTISYKKGGGLAGHNGLKSIASLLGTNDFLRLRIGIGRPTHGSVSSWVLSNFDNEQETRLDDLLAAVEKSLVEFIDSNFDKVFKEYKKRNIFN